MWRWHFFGSDSILAEIGLDLRFTPFETLLLSHVGMANPRRLGTINPIGTKTDLNNASVSLTRHDKNFFKLFIKYK
jgi:hypothetical protein